MNPMEAFSKGFGVTDNLMQSLLNRAQLAETAKYHKGQLGIQQQAQDRAQQEWEMKKSQYDMLQRMMNGEPAQPMQPMPTQEYGQGIGIFTPEGMADRQQQVAAGQPQGDMNAFLQTPIGRGLYHQVYGIDPMSHADVLTGPAREAMDLERLKQQQGENSPVYQMAKANMEAKQQSRQDVSETRQARLGGLKAGESWLHDPDSGEIVGKNMPLTQKERDEHSGRAFLNYTFPILSKGFTPLSGKGSITSFLNAGKNYKTDPNSEALIDNYLLAVKLWPAVTTKESATLQTGKQKNIIGQLGESLKSADIPMSVEKAVKMFNLPPEAAQKADEAFLRIIGDATKRAERSVPASAKRYFNPESQKFEEETTGEYQDDQLVVVEMPNGGEETMTYAQAKALGAK